MQVSQDLSKISIVKLKHIVNRLRELYLEEKLFFNGLEFEARLSKMLELNKLKSNILILAPGSVRVSLTFKDGNATIELDGSKGICNNITCQINKKILI